METIEIRVSEATASLEAAEGTSLRADQVDSAVKSAGFTPRGMTATVVGTIATRGETRLLVWEDVEIELVDGNDVALEDARKVRITGTLTVRRDKTRTSFALASSEVEFLER